MRSTRFQNRAGSRRQRKVEEAEAVLGEYERSGLTQRVFAREMVNIRGQGWSTFGVKSQLVTLLDGWDKIAECRGHYKLRCS
jgi:hypothetical protein